MAESAVRAGYSVSAIDAYADLDLAAIARTTRVTPYSAHAAAAIGRGVPCDAVCYVSNVENHPAVLQQLAAGRPLWGNSAATLLRVRDPMKLATALTNATPACRACAQRTAAAIAVAGTLGGCSSRVRQAVVTASESGNRVNACLVEHVLQERIPGSPGSILFRRQRPRLRALRSHATARRQTRSRRRALSLLRQYPPARR